MTLKNYLRESARDYARSAATSAGQLGADFRMRPSFLIAGAQRCATTSVFRMLAEHPQVQPPLLNKGIHYFDTADRFQRGTKFYAAHFPFKRPRMADRLITGEASPYYMFHPLAATRIAAELGPVKVIILLRDPVERAFSAYKQERGRGFEDLSFEEALKREPQRLAGEEERIIADPTYQSFSHQHHAYVARGCYAGQLERMFAAVGREQVLVLDADAFLSAGLSQWPLLLRHLNIGDWWPEMPVHTNSRPSTPMPEQTRRWLAEQFAEEDKRLVRLLGYVPSWQQ
ncbi:sulfotransferase domain-containing protein [Arthrobacter flavus]|uniref:Sulfotransferase domain-containing protein n=1 Tax=Arthrobacter flavus TaxID=95172 RepID=A0ABW4Q8W1_9MICC